MSQIVKNGVIDSGIEDRKFVIETIRNSLLLVKISAQLINFSFISLIFNLDFDRISLFGSLIKIKGTKDIVVITMTKIIDLLCTRNKQIEELYPVNLKIPSKLINIHSSSPEQLINDNILVFSNVEEILGNSGRIFVRKSGTQSLIRVLIEHESDEVLELAEQKIKSII